VAAIQATIECLCMSLLRRLVTFVVRAYARGHLVRGFKTVALKLSHRHAPQKRLFHHSNFEPTGKDFRPSGPATRKRLLFDAGGLTRVACHH
jgi:hypothetical protein